MYKVIFALVSAVIGIVGMSVYGMTGYTAGWMLIAAVAIGSVIDRFGT
jgi:hypothetical protein